MSNYNLCLFTLEFPPLIGGAGNFTKDLLNSLNLSFKKVFVITIKSTFAQNTSNIIYVNKLFKIDFWYLWAPIFSFFYFLFFGSKFKKILISDYYAFLSFPFVLTYFYRWDIYYVLHGTEVNYISLPISKRDKYFNSIFKFRHRLNRCKNIICVSNFYFLKCKRLLPEFVSKLFLINNSVNFDEFNNQYLSNLKKPYSPSNKFTVLVVSRLIDWKRIDRVIENFIKFNNKYSNSQLLIAGTGPELDLLIQNSKDRVDKSIVFLGNLSRMELIKFYYGATVLVSFSDENESFGLTILEANLCKLPVIGSEIFVMNGVLIDYFNGLVANESNFSIFDKLVELYLDHNLVNQLSENSRRFVLENYNYNTMVDKYIKLLIDE